MGATITIKLPGAARVENVARALSRAAGFTELPVLRGSLTSPGAVDVIFYGGLPKFSAMYHLEYGNGGERGIAVPHDAKWLAAAIAVVDAFGGKVCANPWDGTPTYAAAGKIPPDQGHEGYAALEALTDSVVPVDAAAISRAQAFIDAINEGTVVPAVDSLLISYFQAPQPALLYLVAADSSVEESRYKASVFLTTDAKAARANNRGTFERFGTIFETAKFFSADGTCYPVHVETIAEWRERRAAEDDFYVAELQARLLALAEVKLED